MKDGIDNVSDVLRMENGDEGVWGRIGMGE